VIALYGEFRQLTGTLKLDPKNPAASTFDRSVRMLPLLSIRRPRDTGMSSWRNSAIGCRFPY